MQMVYRASRLNTPDKGETLVHSREQAFALIADLDRKLAGGLSKQSRATFLAARATLYEACGDVLMLKASQEAYAFSKTANTAALVAVALHHFGRLKEANLWYERAYRYPHEAGYEIDIGYTNALLSEGKWLKAWPIVRKLKKRMVYAAYLPNWNGERVKELSVIAEGGFGDIIQNSRYLSECTKRAEHVTVYLPPMFFESGFVELARQQPWYPEIKPLISTPMKTVATGFFDLPGIFEQTPETLFPAPKWKVLSDAPFADFLDDTTLKVGCCWAAGAAETPLCPKGVYRSLTNEQAENIIRKTDGIYWTSLQHNTPTNLGICEPLLKSWMDTADVISDLDAVITVDTAVMHLAASMGKPVWLILSGASDWKFGIEGDTCLWYPNVRLFRNNEFGFENAVNNLITAINGGELHQATRSGD